MKVIIDNKKELARKIKEFRKSGRNKIHVLSDFDRTLTKAFVNGQKVPSAISIIRDGSYISKDYAKKANALAEKYHPVEIDSNISIEEKKKAMDKWWREHFDLLIKSGLSKSDIERATKSHLIQLRYGSKEFLHKLNENTIPLVILSSSGLGGDSISMILKNNNIQYNNISILSNTYKWDKKGKAIGIKEPVIHVFNKDETTLEGLPIYDKLIDRPYIVLLGDSLGDLGMIKGFPYREVIKIGFLDDGYGDLEKYKESFDVVITEDGDFSEVNKILKEILD